MMQEIKKHSYSYKHVFGEFGSFDDFIQVVIMVILHFFYDLM